MSKIHLYHTFLYLSWYAWVITHVRTCVWVCVHGCVYVCLHGFVYMCVHVCVDACMVLCVCMYTHAHVSVDLCQWPRLIWDRVPYCSVLSELHSRVADPWVSGNFTLSVFHLSLGLEKWFGNGSHKDLGHSNSSPYAYIANILPLSHLPSPVTSILHLFMQTVPELKGIPSFLPSWFQNFCSCFHFDIFSCYHQLNCIWYTNRYMFCNACVISFMSSKKL